MRWGEQAPGWVALALALLMAVASACVPNVAAPARSADGYEAAAKKTTDAANGAVGTAQLLCTAGVEGQAFFPYLSIAVSDMDAEDQLGSVSTTFGAIEPPPDQRSDQLRRQVTDLLTRADGDVSDERIAIRRGDASSLPPICDALDRDAQDLQQVPA